MPRRCCVTGCKSNYDSQNEYFTVFRFPKEENLRTKWVSAISRENWSPSQSSVVCAVHFQESEIVRFDIFTSRDGTTRKNLLRFPKLRKDSVPSIFPNLPNCLSKSSVSTKKHPDEPYRSGVVEGGGLGRSLNEYTSNDEIVEIKTEDIIEQFVDGNGIHYRKIYSEGKKDLKSLIGSGETDAEINCIPMEVIKVDQQEIDNSTTSVNNSNEGMASSNSRNFEEDSCEYSTGNNEKVEIKTEHLDTMKQFVDDDEIYDEIKDLKSEIGSDETEQQEIFNSYFDEVLENQSNSKETTHKCHLCSYSANSGNLLETHIDSVHFNTKQHKCQQCDFTAKWKSKLKDHVDSVHLNLKKHRCQLCDFTSKWKRTLEYHVDSAHLNLKRFKCHLCDYASFKKVLVKRHMDAVHLNLKQHKCQLCDYTAKWKRTLKYHVDSVHLNLKQHKCHLCDYAANQKTHLKLHIESTHLNLKQYKCEQCDYAANIKRSLKSHIDSVHLNLTQHKCHFCDYVANKRNLKSHIDSVHLNLKGHKCHLCDFSAKRKFHLKTHIEIVHLNLKQHKCTLCDYASNYKKNLEGHIESVH